MELVLTGRVEQRDGGLVAPGSRTTGDELLDHVLGQIRAENRPRRLKWWVNRLGSGGWGRQPVRRRLIGKLSREGVLRRSEERILGLVPVTRHPPTDPAAADQERDAVGAVLLGRRQPDASTAALIALVEVCGLTGACVPASERRAAKARAGQIAADDQMGGAVRQLQDEAMAAVLAAVVATTASSAAVAGGDGGGGG
jgi:Golgi phosphoprotein 3 GPP34